MSRRRNGKQNSKGSEDSKKMQRSGRSNYDRKDSNKDGSDGRDAKDPAAGSDQASSSETSKGGPVSTPRSTTNDPEWYAQEPNMVLTTCNLPFSDPLGAPLEVIRRGASLLSTTNVDSAAKIHAVSGLASLRLHHSIGGSETLYDPANVAANALYTHVRVVNSGRKNYDPCDLMMYALSIGDLYSMIEWLKRIYGYAFLYSQRNWYIGKELLAANGIDPNDIVQNLANFNTWINTLSAKVSMYAIPSTINYFRRRVFSYSTFYLENAEGNIKDQIYQFVPDGFFAFTLDSNNVGSLQFVQWIYDKGNLATYGDILSYCSSLLNNVYGDEDFSIMSGDIIKAYGTDILGMAPITPDYAVMPMYDPDVLYQMMNADLIIPDRTGTYVDSDGNTRVYGNIYQSSTGIITSKQGAVMSSSARAWDLKRRRLINSDKPMPTPLEVMESTRLMVAPYGNLLASTVTIETGADFVTSIDICEFYSTSNTGSIVSTYNSYGTRLLESTNLIGNAIQKMHDMCAFKYLPRLFYLELDASSNVKEYTIVGDVGNYCIFDNAQLFRMHEVAMLSLFWVPGIARLVNFN